MKNKVRIAYIAKNLNINGVSSVVLNYASKLEQGKYVIDIYAGEPIAERQLCKLAHNRNVSIIKTPNKSAKSFLRYVSFLKKHLKGYDIVHVHGNSRLTIIELLISKINKNKKNIIHSHSISCNHKAIHAVLWPLFKHCYNIGIAPSKESGRWMFRKEEYRLLKNGIDVNEYAFNATVRKAIRSKYEIKEGEIVIGHVGNFSKEKNYEFILEIFDELCEKSDKYRLMLVGKYRNNIGLYNTIKANKYSDKIIIYGETERPSLVYNSMDCFIFPSLYEGFGIVLLEAQCNGLPCIISDKIPSDAIIDNEIVKTLCLDEKNKWLSNLESIKNRSENVKSNDTSIIKEVDSAHVVNELDKIYMECLA